ncbi:MAG: peptide chain release factor N(5)-glutamine methyltransferase [bacterium]
MADRLAAVISRAAAVLVDAGIDRAKSEVELILCHILGVDRLDLYLRGEAALTEDILGQLQGIIKRRAERYPLQYILGESWFYGRKFHVSPAVMVPTPETELLCETAIGFVHEKGLPQPRVLDVGVGSGVIAVTVAAELDECEVLAIDCSPDAIDITHHNAEELGVGDKIEFRQSDFFAEIHPDEKFNLILSNPPYISDSEYESLPPEVLADPKTALLAGEDGLDAIRVILRDAPDYLAEDGLIMFEIGYRQADRVVKLTETDDRYRSIVILRDLNDIDRVVALGCNGRD